MENENKNNCKCGGDCACKKSGEATDTPTNNALISLEEHNAKARGFYWAADEPHPNGIACPKCGEEMVDSDNTILTSMPPQKNVHCPQCNYRGYRIA